MPNADVVRSEVEKILASPGFENAERLKQLLRYTTEKALDGTSSELKEYTIGVDVFGRGDRFDPKVDSIVRPIAGIRPCVPICNLTRWTLGGLS